MSKTWIVIVSIIAGVAAVGTVVFFAFNNWMCCGVPATPTATSAAQLTATSQVQSTATATAVRTDLETCEKVTPGAAPVPCPAIEDVIRQFVTAIDQGRVQDAFVYMADSLIGDDASKQSWGVTFNSFESGSITSLDAYASESWTNTQRVYKVVLNVALKPGADILWDNGENTRWFTLDKSSGIWKILNIATGP